MLISPPDSRTYACRAHICGVRAGYVLRLHPPSIWHIMSYTGVPRRAEECSREVLVPKLSRMRCGSRSAATFASRLTLPIHPQTIILSPLRSIDHSADSVYRRLLCYVSHREKALREICEQSGCAWGEEKKPALCTMYGMTYFRWAEKIGRCAHYVEPIRVRYLREEVRAARRVTVSAFGSLLPPKFSARGMREEHAMSLVLNVYENAAIRLITDAWMSL